MTAGRSDREPVRIRRRGRHATPTQVGKVAQQAGRAAPAVAIASALMAAPQVSHALADSGTPTAQNHTTAASGATTSTAAATALITAPSVTAPSITTRSVTVTAARQARHAAKAHSTTYRVQAGDTLSMLASRFFHNSDWQYLYHVNAKTISNPDALTTGQSLVIPASAPAHYALAGYVPRHAMPAQVTAPAVHTVSTTSSAGTSSQSSGSAAGSATVAAQPAPQGQYSCSGLEQLWQQAGGSPGAAVMAADIAMAESGGNPNAISPTDDFGLWQINASNGSLATLNPFQNAKSAITLSGNGTDWNPWTTYRTGAYAGHC
ncbi:MAG TPA: LysM peptidoglycan-binding domain-containing protein [Trebonia sp.]|nr:LysM peptidoglycan-binding domain-containing protein [Trebonia sp.]